MPAPHEGSWVSRAAQLVEVLAARYDLTDRDTLRVVADQIAAALMAQGCSQSRARLTIRHALQARGVKADPWRLPEE